MIVLKWVFPVFLAVLAIVHLISCWRGDDDLRTPTKVALMPVVALAYLAFARMPSLWVVAGLLFGCLGDLFLLWPLKKKFFALGTSSFFLGHVCYLIFIYTHYVIRVSWIWIVVVGVVYFVIYYLVFRFMITKFNYKTPGREDDGQEVKKLDKKMSDEMMATIIEGLGGADNIQHVDACFTRLRVKVKDKALVMPDTDWKQKTGANGVVQVADGVQIIYGAKADIYKNNLKSALNMD